MYGSHRREIVEVLDRDLKTIKVGRSEDVVEWIFNHPLECETVAVEGVFDLLSIDDYMDRYDVLQEEES